ncbi:hypothetical protein FJ250_08650, partial [bacterium]|nr:hypothetical protein [bacterium]
MKKLLFAVCALAAISVLAPDAGYAQSWENRIGMYTSETAAAAHVPSAAAMSTHSIYFVVSNPEFTDGSPFPNIDAFEFMVVADPASGWFKLSETKPAGTIDVGVVNTAAGTYEYIAGWPAPLPVVGGMVKVMDWSIMITNTNPLYFRLQPIASTTPSVPGKLAVNHTAVGGANLVGCMPSSPGFSDPVFAINGTTV